mmetsp:Transcript_73294/g.201277  ORF Transcript_73294/g.201277 Transcript_73294/m.201277 type:complete len:210 (+) Transcript_73294:227-856(+)
MRLPSCGPTPCRAPCPAPAVSATTSIVSRRPHSSPTPPTFPKRPPSLYGGCTQPTPSYLCSPSRLTGPSLSRSMSSHSAHHTAFLSAHRMPFPLLARSHVTSFQQTPLTRPLTPASRRPFSLGRLLVVVVGGGRRHIEEGQQPLRERLAENLAAARRVEEGHEVGEATLPQRGDVLRLDVGGLAAVLRLERRRHLGLAEEPSHRAQPLL